MVSIFTGKLLATVSWDQSIRVNTTLVQVICLLVRFPRPTPRKSGGEPVYMSAGYGHKIHSGNVARNFIIAKNILLQSQALLPEKWDFELNRIAGT